MQIWFKIDTTPGTFDHSVATTCTKRPVVCVGSYNNIEPETSGDGIALHSYSDKMQ